MATEINRNYSLTVGTTVTVVSEQTNYPTNERKVISLINTSTGGQNITIAFSDQAIAGSGVFLAPGGYYQESHDAGFTPSQAQITAVSSGAGGTLAIQERILVRG